MDQPIDRRDFVKLTATAGAGLSLAGLVGCQSAEIGSDAVLRSVEDVDPEQAVARAEPGVRSIEMDAATQQHGLATVMAACPTVGIGGFRS